MTVYHIVLQQQYISSLLIAVTCPAVNNIPLSGVIRQFMFHYLELKICVFSKILVNIVRAFRILQSYKLI